jgi:DNA adenine methylase
MFKISRKRNQKFHYSPLRYPGGKTFLLPFFEKIIEANKLHDVTYVEPYAGGAGAALALLFLEHVDRIVINDLDNAIYAFWKSAVFRSDEFVECVKSTPVTVREWRRQKAIYSDRRARLFDLGFATFFLNRTNVSGILDGGPIGGLDQQGDWLIDARYNKEGLSERIRQLGLYRDRISVSNLDGIELIRDYVKRKDVFIYLDPPYFEKGATLYLNHYQESDHASLAKLLNDNADAFWLLTYDNQNQIRSLYPKRRINNFSLNYNAYESRKGHEILVLSDGVKA